MNNENDLVLQRRKKVNDLRAADVNPYAYNFKKKDNAAALKKKYKDLEEGQETKDAVSIAGRVMTLRDMGKAGFFHVQDETGQLQVYVKEADLKDAFAIYKKVDIGDIVGIRGTIFTTKKGEISIYASHFEILTKSLLPLPEKWHGLKDVEKRYRQRYVDLIVNPKVRETFINRTKIINSLRNFLIQKGYLEVQTPILQPIYGGGFARPFETFHNELKMKMFMRISDEMYLKRLIVGGYEKVFEFCMDFRNEGVDTTHNPEFFMIEMMTAYQDYLDGMKLIEESMAHVAKEVTGSEKVMFQGVEYDLGNWEKLTMMESITKHFDIDPEKMSEKELLAFVKKHKLPVKGESKGELMNIIFEELVQPKLIQPTIIYDYPVEVSALAKAHRSKPGYTERFEMFIHGIEYGNNYTELTDPDVLEKRFKEELKRSDEGDDEAHPMDEDFINAMKYGMPPTCGTAIGMDRFIMLLTDSPSIRDVLFFPAMKPVEE